MNTEYRRYIVKIGNTVITECDSFNEAKIYADTITEAFGIKTQGIVFDNYEFAIVYRATV